MDGQRFDDLTRALAAGTSRRRALKLLAGALGGALAGRRATAAAQDCRRLGRRCGGDRPCCDGLACLEGVCIPSVVAPVATCAPPFGDCSGGQACCLGTSCAGGVCCPVTLACGDVCCGNGTLCLNGACSTPGGAFLCPSGQRLCGAAGCRDLSSDPSNCGSCGRVCPNGVCSSGACVVGQGTPCTAGSQCSSGVCADGVCCDRACAGQCEACNLAGVVGTCSVVVGAPVGARPPCASDGGVCGGVCAGTRGDACAYPGDQTVCRAASCAGGEATAAAGCNGAGACPAAATVACFPFACGAGACRATCGGDGDCAAGAYCGEGGVCRPDEDLGTACGDAAECTSGFCVDGVCCNGACAGQCEACDVDGSEGLCVPVSGAPVGARPSCAGTGACAGTCDGTTRAACAYPGANTVCAQPTCAGGGVTAARVCDGAGGCAPGRTDSCAPYAVCDSAGAACATTCAGDADCVGAAYCTPEGRCAGDQANGADCTSASQCASGFCVDDVCCDGPCDAACVACNLDGLGGTCSPEPNNTSCGTDQICCDRACVANNTETTCGTCGNACPSGQICENPATGVCDVRPASVDLGGACDEPTDCGSGTCQNGRCCLPAATPCRGVSGNCCSGVCVGGTCQAGPVDTGGRCDENADCVSRVCVSGTCRAEVSGTGGPCDDDFDCDSASVCGNGTCCRSVGLACPNGNGDCCSGACVGGFCQAQGGTGATCDDNADCASNVCVAGTCQAGKGGSGAACDDTGDCQYNVCCGRAGARSCCGFGQRCCSDYRGGFYCDSRCPV